MNKVMHPIEPEELMAYLDGELPADRAAEAAAHVNECADCQLVVTAFRGVSQSLNTWQLYKAESPLPHAIAAALNDGDRKLAKPVQPDPRSWRKIFGLHWGTAAWMGALAAIFLVVIGSVRFIGGNANSVFSQVGSAISQDEAPAPAVPPQSASRNADKLALRASKDGAPTVQGQVVADLHQHGYEEMISPGPETRTRRSEQVNVLPASGPMIIRTAQLSLITKEFDRAWGSLEGILKRHRGYVADLKVGGTTGAGRTLSATLRVPADQLDVTLAEVKTLGRVESESQSGQDITSQYVDLQARLENARNTSKRLTDLLQNRTGKLSDVLEVEQELDRVRGEIEQMEAERKNLSNQVSLATLNVTITEDYKAQLQVVPPSTATRLSNAAVEGYKSMVEGVMSLALFLLSSGPSLLLWAAIFFIPARLVWKRVRKSAA